MASGQQRIPEEAEPGEQEYGGHDRLQRLTRVSGCYFFHRPRPPFRVATMVDSKILSPKGDISITKRDFVGNGRPSGAQIRFRRYNLARESRDSAGGGRGRTQGRSRARDRRQARQGWFRTSRGVGRRPRLQPRRELRGSGGKDRRQPSWRLRRSRHSNQGTKPDGGRDRSPAREP